MFPPALRALSWGSLLSLRALSGGSLLFFSTSCFLCLSSRAWHQFALFQSWLYLIQQGQDVHVSVGTSSSFLLALFSLRSSFSWLTSFCHFFHALQLSGVFPFIKRDSCTLSLFFLSKESLMERDALLISLSQVFLCLLMLFMQLSPEQRDGGEESRSLLLSIRSPLWLSESLLLTCCCLFQWWTASSVGLSFHPAAAVSYLSNPLSFRTMVLPVVLFFHFFSFILHPCLFTSSIALLNTCPEWAEKSIFFISQICWNYFILHESQ